MGYLQEADRWLDALIADEKMSVDDVKRAIREKLLESYRNGLKAAGQSPAPRASSHPPRRFAGRTPR